MSESRNQFGIGDFTVVSSESCYSGFFAIDRIKVKHKLYKGGWSGEFYRELFIRDPGAGVLLYDADLDRVVLVEQFRIGAIQSESQAHTSPWMLELVAGIVDCGETAAQVVQREAVEDADCRVKKVVQICEYYNRAGGTNGKISLFCGQVDAADSGGIFGLEKENEDIQVIVMSFSDAYQAILDGSINNAMTIIALQWLKLNKQKVRESWGEQGC